MWPSNQMYKVTLTEQRVSALQASLAPQADAT